MKRRLLLLSPLAGALASAAHAQQVTLDPAGSSPILSALTWLQGSLMGNVATAAAVIAIGVIGFMMLTGRIDWRRGVVVVLGCFVLFGAAAIVAGIRQVAGA
jgi:type IV secretion system protein VirB2